MTGGIRMRAPRRGWAALTLVLLFAAASACERVPEELRPPQVLVDSLGIAETDAVWEVGLRVVSGSEVANPRALTMTFPGWISFRSDDPRPRRVILDTAGLSADQRAWLEPRTLESPPLVHAEARWVVDFREAPVGEWVFRIIGSAAEGRVQVEVPAPR